MTWNWESESWPNFAYSSEDISTLEKEFLLKSGELAGLLKYISKEDEETLKVDLLSDEALKTSEIEGEILNRDSVQSSIRKHLGLKTDNRKIPAAEFGVSAMTSDLYQNYKEPLSHEKLFSWHKLLMNGRTDVLEIGMYRTDDEPMQIVSGPDYKREVHYEAPPAEKVDAEMEEFINWFNSTQSTLPALTRAAIAHWYFICIHPFEDGNGRIARAISEYALAQNLGYPTLIALAYTIEKHKKDYYSNLGKHNRTNEIHGWLTYFAETIIEAQKNTEKRIQFILAKSKMMAELSGKINERQEKALLRMFREGIDGFKGGLSAENYISITGTTTATASRDLRDLVEKGALIKTGELRYTRYFLDI